MTTSGAPHRPLDAEVLALPMQSNDADADTVLGYLIRLLSTVWDEAEGFSGKRPFGNSGWECELYIPLIRAGLVAGTVDDNGYLDKFGDEARHQADHLIAKAILSLGVPRPNDASATTSSVREAGQ